MTLKKRSSSTAGLSEHLRPLPKGMACLACKQRKVRCSGTYPACSSCLRTAKFADLSPESVVCQYTGGHEGASDRADSPAVEKKQKKVTKEEPVTQGLTKAGLMVDLNKFAYLNPSSSRPQSPAPTTTSTSNRSTYPYSTHATPRGSIDSSVSSSAYSSIHSSGSLPPMENLHGSYNTLDLLPHHPFDYNPSYQIMSPPYETTPSFYRPPSGQWAYEGTSSYTFPSYSILHDLATTSPYSYSSDLAPGYSLPPPSPPQSNPGGYVDQHQKSFHSPSLYPYKYTPVLDGAASNQGYFGVDGNRASEMAQSKSMMGTPAVEGSYVWSPQAWSGEERWVGVM